MKNTLLVLSIAYCSFAHAQTPNWQWAKSASGTSFEQGHGCSTDAGGNIFVTGYFMSPTITFGTTVLTNAGGTDMFIVKYDAGGNVLWAQRAGGTSGEGGWGCSTDAGGNIFVTGFFQSPTITFGTTVLTNADNTGFSDDMFIVKYDAGGNVLWAKSAGGTSDDNGSGCSTDAGGNIFVTGSFQSPTLSFGTTVLNNAGNTGTTNDMFIVKYDAGGNVLWAQRAGGTWSEGGLGCSTDAGGNVFVTGSFASPTLSFGTTVLTNTGYYDMFIVKYDSSGNVLWAKSAGGASGDHGRGCSTDAGGNIFVTGVFYSPTITFGTTVLNNANNTGITSDMFIVKYDAGGNALWAKSAGGASNDYGWGCSTGAGGNIFVIGVFGSPTITFGTTVLTNSGSEDMFIVKYGPNGNALWAKSAGGASSDIGQGCFTDAGGNVFVTGYFQSPTLSFGITVLTNTNAGYDDMFIVKLAGTAGINELSGEESFTVSPNPFSTQTTVQITSYEIRGTSYECEIYNVYGRIVKQFVTRHSSFVISRDNLASGLYFVRLTTPSPSGEGGGEVIYTDKLVITDK